jgi:hypothetical protein
MSDSIPNLDLPSLDEPYSADELTLDDVRGLELELEEYEKNPDDVIPWAEVRASLHRGR